MATSKIFLNVIIAFLNVAPYPAVVKRVESQKVTRVSKMIHIAQFLDA